uniref:DUF3040 domain-containing protein n=1 Tax=Pseudonocardia nigra TaxID=1921578 RepID=UPI001C5EABC7
MLADRPHGRRLTAAERMRLEELERRLREDDPELAEALRGGRPRQERPRPLVIAISAAAALVLVVLAAVVGGPAAAAAMLL